MPSGKYLEGELSPAVGELDELRLLYLMTNKLTGPIPEEIGNLKHLARMLLRDNRLQGTLPASIGKLNLKDLYFDGNQLSGAVPDGDALEVYLTLG